MPEECDGCTVNDGTHKRAWWNVCDTCMAEFDQLKRDARANLLLLTYTADAHLFRISGTAWGDITRHDAGSSMEFTFRRVVAVEDVCQWCAIRKALLALDPWAFRYRFEQHGTDTEHDPHDVKDGCMWSWIDGEMTLNVEDLGVIGEDRWGRRLGRLMLPGMGRKR
jgi:hypothetical protein